MTLDRAAKLAAANDVAAQYRIDIEGKLDDVRKIVADSHSRGEAMASMTMNLFETAMNESTQVAEAVFELCNTVAVALIMLAERPVERS